MKLKKVFRILFLSVTVLTVLFSFACKQNNSKTMSNEGFPLKFSIVKDGEGKDNGTLIALANGKVISSGSKIAKGTEVTLIGSPIKDRWTLWKGIPKPADPYIAKFIMEKPVDVQVEFKLPILPGENISIFTINDVGVGGKELFEDAFLEHLDDGTNPLYICDSGKNPVDITLKIGSTSYEDANGIDGNPIENIKISIDNSPAEQLKLTNITSPEGLVLHTYKHSITLNDSNEHSIQVEIYPKNKKSFSEIICSFRLKSSENNPKIPGIGFLLNNEIIFKNNYKVEKPLPEEAVELGMQTTKDVISKVEIIEDGKAREIPIKKYETVQGEIYHAAGRVLLPAGGVYKKYTIKAYPKDTENYRASEMVFELAGTKIANNNAEFVTTPSDSGPTPKVSYDITYYDNKSHPYLDCYGQISVDIEAITRSPRAKVKYFFADLDGNMITMPEDTSPQEKEMTTDGLCKHWTKIKLYTDKPTILKAYVLAEDGVTKNDTAGAITEIFNRIDFRWDTRTNANGEDFANDAYDEIKITRAALNALPVVDGKKYIYAAFKVIKEEAYEGIDNYTIKSSGYPAYQSPYKKLNEDEDFWQWYETKIDVTSLGAAAGPLEIVLPILEDNKACFTYKAKVKLES